MSKKVSVGRERTVTESTYLPLVLTACLNTGLDFRSFCHTQNDAQLICAEYEDSNSRCPSMSRSRWESVWETRIASVKHEIYFLDISSLKTHKTIHIAFTSLISGINNLETN